MLRVFFFVMTYVTDDHGSVELMRGGCTLGLGNAAVMGFASGAWLLRRWRVKRAWRRRVASSSCASTGAVSRQRNLTS